MKKLLENIRTMSKKFKFYKGEEPTLEEWQIFGYRLYLARDLLNEAGYLTESKMTNASKPNKCLNDIIKCVDHFIMNMEDVYIKSCDFSKQHGFIHSSVFYPLNYTYLRFEVRDNKVHVDARSLI